MRAAGFFDTTSHPEISDIASPTMSTLDNKGGDSGTLLWTLLKKELEDDESGFKHRVSALDYAIKGVCCVDLEGLHDKVAGHLISSDAIEENFPWNGCKFAAMAVMHCVSARDAASKRAAVQPVCRSLGGCTIPPPTELSHIRWPYELSQKYSTAVEDTVSHGICTAILVSVTDVEIMRNPSKSGGRTSRPGTFAHCFVIAVSRGGFYLYQAYGPRGYTLFQNMEHHSESGDGITFPLSLAEGKNWVKHFEEFSGELSGVWTQPVNDAYAYCFDVDLAKMGRMQIGSQLDAYFTTLAVKFDGGRVRENLALLPKPDKASYPKCYDGVVAKAERAPAESTPDGGTPHYYVPVILRCAKCGKNDGRNKQCGQCKKVKYCSRECQVADWDTRHKRVCKLLALK